jgi:carbonic anhydrase/acetyltransferase-like protein (isoleucine patch superfamily)
LVNTVLGGSRSYFRRRTIEFARWYNCSCAVEKHVTQIGYNVSIGHNALIHAIIIEDFCFIGVSAIFMGNVVVETGGMVAARSLGHTLHAS